MSNPLTRLPSALLLAVSFNVSAVTLPTLPLIFDASYVAPSGHTIAVNSGADLQAALNQAQLGDTIVLQAGASFTGPYTLPNKTNGSGWIYVQSSAYAQLPTPGTRIGPSDAANMPKIIAPANDNAIVTVNNSHHYRFVGIEFKTTPNTYAYDLVALGNDNRSTATLAHHITFDRCYFFADTSVGARRGLVANAAYLAVVDSYFEGFREKGADSQAILTYNTSGPIKIVNNFLSAAGENLLFGGADSTDVALIPSDVEIRGNYFFKPLSWIGSEWSVKNLLEFKSVRRALVTSNVFENNWAAAQTGFSVLITPRNQNGSAPWSVTEDITIANNRFINIGSGFNVGGTDDEHPSKPTARVLIKNNLLKVNGLNGAQGWAFMILSGPRDVTIDHNTVFASSAFLFAENAPGTPMTDQFSFTNNIIVSATGLIGTGTSTGVNTLNRYFSNWKIARNALTSGSGESYPSDNFFPTQTSAIRFVNASAGDYTLANDSPYRSAGTDGLDLGADSARLPANSASSGMSGAPTSTVPQPPKAFQVR